MPSLSARRAWIEIAHALSCGLGGWSLSARRAWIEISELRRFYQHHRVALRKESVDRNFSACQRKIGRLLSLSARRAWIEILMQCQIKKYSGSLSARRAWIEIGLNFARKICCVSLSARRAWIEISRAANCQHRSHRRSPQGERG